MHNIPARLIDFHVHLFPDRLADAIWSYFDKQYQLGILYKFYYRECIGYLRERGVEKIVYSNYAHREGIARGLNDWNRRVLDEDENLYCFAACHPGDADVLSYVSAILDHPRVLGIKLHFHVQRFYPHDERLYPLYELIADRKKRILLHVGNGPLDNEFVGLEHFRRLLKRYPDLPANIAHMGAFEYREFLELLDAHPNIYLDTAFAFFQEQQGNGAFDQGGAMLEKYKGRILYGSDFPNLILPRESELATLSAYRLSAAFYDKVFFRNGMELIDSVVKGPEQQNN
ncbi:MAG: amidohydrolase [Deltaproteobacteria bacterium]|jgi:predicted TIM-barrel fold metal-dependent hydrolase|nr:amidohydrolase [Deltaproteobacteria bacterium]